MKRASNVMHLHFTNCLVFFPQAGKASSNTKYNWFTYLLLQYLRLKSRSVNIPFLFIIPVGLWNSPRRKLWPDIIALRDREGLMGSNFSRKSQTVSYTGHPWRRSSLWSVWSLLYLEVTSAFLAFHIDASLFPKLYVILSSLFTTNFCFRFSRKADEKYGKACYL